VVAWDASTRRRVPSAGSLVARLRGLGPDDGSATPLLLQFVDASFGGNTAWTFPKTLKNSQDA
jgi:hypothetical protein